jgi:hypothetical protein
MRKVGEENEQTPQAQEQLDTTKVQHGTLKSGLNITEKVPRVLLEVLVYGKMIGDEDKEVPEKKMQGFLKHLKDQIDSVKKNGRVRALWVAEKGMATIEDKKNWLIENSNCKYYLIIDDNYVIPPTFIKDALLKIKKLEEAIVAVKDAGIVIKKNVMLNTEHSTNLKVVK